MNEPAADARRLRSRRTVVTGAAAAALASVVASGRAQAAAGKPVLQGLENAAGPARTTPASRAESSTLLVTNSVGRAVVAKSSQRDAFAVLAVDEAGRVGNGAGLRAESRKHEAIQARSFSGSRAGIFGLNTTQSRGAFGVVGRATVGVLGVARVGSGWGVFSAGDAGVDGDLFVNGRILQPNSAAAGTAELNGSGSALVRAGHAESGAQYHYQLTAIGAPMPNLHVVERADGAFAIAGGKPGGRVSWQRARRAEETLTAQARPAKQQPATAAYKER